MSRYKNIVPAGEESEEDYDDYGDYEPHRNVIIQPQVEDFQLTLQYACQSNNVQEIIRTLSSSSIEINNFLHGSWTALMYASFNGSIDAMKYLLDNGADPTISYDCHNVIMCVCNCNNVCIEDKLLKCLQLLLPYNMDINAKDRSGMTALMYACSNGWSKLVEMLVHNGAQIEAKNNQNGETALFFAVRCNSVNTVKFLLSHGADKDAEDKRYQTIHRIAENKGMTEILNLLSTAYSKDQHEMYDSDEYTYWDQVIYELSNGFKTDIKIFLENLSMDIYIDRICSKSISFKQLLTGNEVKFNEMGITLSPHRKLMETALKTFHVWNWSNQSLGLKKKKDFNAENLIQFLAIIVRQLHILDASLIYLGTHSYNLDPQKGEKAKMYLQKIKSTENKIFIILDKQIKKKKVDYMGIDKINVQNQSSSFKYIVIVTTAIIIVTLYKMYK
ncbi:ankyrin repeat, SAM and basic leucine zipper domain-containing protein 1-like [Daktulosphaira vitifoliae]|uniref:ankyrin repeat, SAM and basic leucine zipper domain-containing protein 1-like n=1 Tax=Daktulosphaira vitifoliae TaxID=58002 RepID=UPI0021AA3D59|nr:ankyrin repeat, SAM and basic leucine zipper domain-containing protein 1-like [Daktulosphaira vitifoliae]